MPVVYVSAAGTARLGALVAGLKTPQPDAALIMKCERFLFPREQSSELYRLTPRGYMNTVTATRAERDRLEDEIAEASPTTSAGRRAKAEVALSILGRPCGMSKVAVAALRDFLRGDGGAA
jgi:hypothetical protein